MRGNIAGRKGGLSGKTVCGSVERGLMSIGTEGVGDELPKDKVEGRGGKTSRPFGGCHHHKLNESTHARNKKKSRRDAPRGGGRGRKKKSKNCH